MRRATPSLQDPAVDIVLGVGHCSTYLPSNDVLARCGATSEELAHRIRGLLEEWRSSSIRAEGGFTPPEELLRRGISKVKELAEGIEERFGDAPIILVSNTLADLLAEDTKGICRGLESGDARVCFLAVLRLHLGVLHLLNAWGEASAEELEEAFGRLAMIQLYASIYEGSDEWARKAAEIRGFVEERLRDSPPRMRRLALLDALLITLEAMGFSPQSLVHVAYVYVSRRSGYSFTKEDLESEDRVLKMIVRPEDSRYLL